jgi:hypothetical protein
MLQYVWLAKERKMVTVLTGGSSIPKSAPVHLSFHVAATLNIGAEEARRLVNRQVVTELGTGLIARDPELTIDGEQVMWRVPIVLSLPGLGDLGQVGTVDVDAESGNLLIDTDNQERIIQHARRLYAGATLQAE